MMDRSSFLHDHAVRHVVALGRYSNHVVRRVLAVLNLTNEDIVAKIAAAEASGKSTAELEALLAQVKMMNAAGWVQIGATMRASVGELSAAELEFQRAMLAKALPIQFSISVQSQALTGPQVAAAAMARPFQGKFLREWLADAEEASARRVREAIRIGFVESESIPQIVRRIRGTKAASYRDGILEISRRGAEAMVRTAITHTANVAAQENYKASAEHISGVEWVSTLDSRTTIICAARDGKVYPLNSGPRPPAHVNCRSTTIARLNGMEPMKRTTFEAWIKGQPEEVQDEVLGATRAALLRSGSIKLDRFIDARGNTLTIDQLRARDGAAFAKAGL